MKIAKAQTTQKDTSVNTSYDAVESAIDLAKKTAGTWEQLARSGRIRRWNSEIGLPQGREDCPSSEENNNPPS
jgi:hypothetical protein